MNLLGIIPNLEPLLPPRLLLVKGESGMYWGTSAARDLKYIMVRRDPDT